MHLFDLCPALCAQPRVALCRTPSATRALPQLSRHLTGRDKSTCVYLKDDGALNALYGGNKTRKLEWILGDALARGARSVWTAGGLGSHHALATARHAHALGLACHILQVPQHLTSHARSTLEALRATEAQLTLIEPPRVGERPPASFKRQLYAWLGRSPETPYDPDTHTYYIPSGGSSHLGTLGYVEAGLELASAIERGELPSLDAIYLALGTGSTAAGLTLGLRLAGLMTEVVGVAVVPRYLVNQRLVQRQIERGAMFLRERGVCINDMITGFTALRGHLGPGYGHPSVLGSEAKELAYKDDLTLDPIYTAKALGALCEMERGRGRATLFWNTLARR